MGMEECRIDQGRNYGVTTEATAWLLRLNVSLKTDFIKKKLSLRWSYIHFFLNRQNLGNEAGQYMHIMQEYKPKSTRWKCAKNNRKSIKSNFFLKEEEGKI